MQDGDDGSLERWPGAQPAARGVEDSTADLAIRTYPARINCKGCFIRERLDKQRVANL